MSEPMADNIINQISMLEKSNDPVVSHSIEDSNIMKRLYYLKWGTHHPDCEYYNNHIFRIFSYPLCIGCFFMTIGIIIGGLLVLFTQIITWNALFVWFLGFLMYLSAILQVKISPDKKLKMLLRFVLGIGTSFLFAPIFILPWDFTSILIKIGDIALFWYVFDKTIKYRGKRIDDPCKTCKHGSFPFCRHKYGEIKKLISDIDNNSIEILEPDNKIIPLLHALKNQFEEGENRILFERDFNDPSDAVCDTCN